MPSTQYLTEDGPVISLRESYLPDLSLTHYSLPDDNTAVEALKAEREISRALGRD